MAICKFSVFLPDEFSNAREAYGLSGIRHDFLMGVFVSMNRVKV